MPQSLVKNLIHLVYSTKNRRKWIPEPVRESLFNYQASIFREWDSPAIAIGGVDDHVHSFFALSRNVALSKMVQELKQSSSKWMKIAGTMNRAFYWQNGYAAFSVSESNAGDVKRYVENQKAHHQEMTFQDELRALFARHHLRFDERYVWD